MRKYGILVFSELLYKAKLCSKQSLKYLDGFLKDRKHRVVMNDLRTSWVDVEVKVSQISVLGPLFFLRFINTLSDDLASNPKLLADDTSLFSIVKSINNSGTDLNNHLRIMDKWEIKWKMSFNPHPTK